MIRNMRGTVLAVSAAPASFRQANSRIRQLATAASEVSVPDTCPDEAVNRRDWRSLPTGHRDTDLGARGPTRPQRLVCPHAGYIQRARAVCLRSRAR